MRVYRIHNDRRAPNDAMGARIAGGRWNPKGYMVLYAATHLSLACLEKLVHLEAGVMPQKLRYSWADLQSAPGSLDPASMFTGAMTPPPRSASNGLFTGKKLASFINASGSDYVGARRIINEIASFPRGVHARVAVQPPLRDVTAADTMEACVVVVAQPSQIVESVGACRSPRAYEFKHEHTLGGFEAQMRNRWRGCAPFGIRGVHQERPGCCRRHRCLLTDTATGEH